MLAASAFVIRFHRYVRDGSLRAGAIREPNEASLPGLPEPRRNLTALFQATAGAPNRLGSGPAEIVFSC